MFSPSFSFSASIPLSQVAVLLIILSFTYKWRPINYQTLPVCLPGCPENLQNIVNEKTKWKLKKAITRLPDYLLSITNITSVINTAVLHRTLHNNENNTTHTFIQWLLLIFQKLGSLTSVRQMTITTTTNTNDISCTLSHTHTHIKIYLSQFTAVSVFYFHFY